MARTRKSLPRVDVAHLISTGVLASVCPRALIDEVLAHTGKASQRERLLPAPAVVYYVMALALWREAPLEEVLRVVCEGLQWLGGGKASAVQVRISANVTADFGIVTGLGVDAGLRGFDCRDGVGCVG